MVTELEHLEDEYNGFDAEAWRNLRGNLSARKSINLIKKFFPKEVAKKFAVAYLGMRYVDDGVDLPWDGKGEDDRKEFLELIESWFYAVQPGDYTEARKIMESKDPLDLLIPKPGQKITSKHTENLLKTFYYLYRGQTPERIEFLKDMLEDFFDGMHMDLKKEGGTFTQEELEDYFRKIQCDPIIIGMSTVVDFEKDLPDNVSYPEFYNSINDISQGIMSIKNVRGREIWEDAKKLKRIYFSDEELGDLTRDEFMDIVNNKGGDKRLNEIIKKRVHKANAYFNRGGETILKLPNEGIYLGLKRFMAAYGLLTKHWGKRLSENGYNPLSDGGYVDIEPGKMDQLSIFINARAVGKSKKKDAKVYGKVLNWDFLENELLSEMQEQIGYAMPDE